MKQTIIFIFKESNFLLLNNVLSIIALRYIYIFYIYYIYIMYHPLDPDFLVISQPEVHSILPHSILVAICGTYVCIHKSI